jgi:Fe2+ or Zn2+ uptake regulation protein
VTEDRLRDAGLRVTRARIAVLEALERLGDHPTADEIHASIIGTGNRVSRATVFNAVDDLTAASLVMRADAGPGAARYEAAAAAHHHFICNRCGKVLDVAVAGPTTVATPLPGVPGRVDDTQIIYRGVCSSCLEP